MYICDHDPYKPNLNFKLFVCCKVGLMDYCEVNRIVHISAPAPVCMSHDHGIADAFNLTKQNRSQLVVKAIMMSYDIMLV